jgi:hypothetical protein
MEKGKWQDGEGEKDEMGKVEEVQGLFIAGRVGGNELGWTIVPESHPKPSASVVTKNSRNKEMGEHNLPLAEAEGEQRCKPFLCRCLADGSRAAV